MVDYGMLAQEHNRKVNTIAAQIEKNDAMLEIARSNVRIAIVDDKRATHYLDDYLNDETQEVMVTKIIESIESSRNSKVREFNKLTGIEEIAESVKEQKNVGNVRCETELNIKCEESKAEVSSKVPDTLDVDKFIMMYESGTTKQEMAKEFGIQETTVYGYSSKLGIKRKSNKKQKEDKTNVELSKELVRSKYTLTDKPIKEVAKELGVTQFELHEFVNRNDLKRPTKKDKQFRDSEVQKKRNTPS